MNFGDLKTSYVVCMLSCGEFSKGSGFFVIYQGRNYLVTDDHVVYDKEKARLYGANITVTATIQNETYESSVVFNLNLDENQERIIYSEDTDLWAIELTATNMQNQHGQEYIRINQLSYLVVQNEDILGRWSHTVYIYGYPTSLMPEAPFEIKPFLAKGVISSYDTETGQFVTDIPVYYGNSGCPVIFVNNDNEVHLIGVVQKLIPFKLDWKNKYETSFIRMDWHNSGYSICMGVNKLLELLESV